VSLGEVCELKYGKSLPESVRAGGNVPVFGSNGQVGAHDEALTAGPTIVVGRKGSFGEVNYSTSACWPIDTTYYVDETATQADLRWLAYRLASLSLNKLNRAAAVPGLNREDAYRQRLLLPPLPEQRRIAEILDKADALRAKRRAALAQLDTLTQSIFLDMFGDPATNSKGWSILRIGDVADVQGGLQVTTARKNLPRKAPYLRVANVYRGYLDLTEIKTIRATDAEIARTTLLTGDLLIVEGHGNPAEIGRGALWDGSIAGCLHQNHIIRARFAGASVVPLYACEYLNSPGGRRHLLRAGKTTSGLNTISVSEV
jgi:type I restriction enzyme S subunit